MATWVFISWFFPQSAGCLSVLIEMTSIQYFYWSSHYPQSMDASHSKNLNSLMEFMVYLATGSVGAVNRHVIHYDLKCPHSVLLTFVSQELDWRFRMTSKFHFDYFRFLKDTNRPCQKCSIGWVLNIALSFDIKPDDLWFFGPSHNFHPSRSSYYYNFKVLKGRIHPYIFIVYPSFWKSP